MEEVADSNSVEPTIFYILIFLTKLRKDNQTYNLIIGVNWPVEEIFILLLSAYFALFGLILCSLAGFTTTVPLCQAFSLRSLGL